MWEELSDVWGVGKKIREYLGGVRNGAKRYAVGDQAVISRQHRIRASKIAAPVTETALSPPERALPTWWTTILPTIFSRIRAILREQTRVLCQTIKLIKRLDVFGGMRMQDSEG
jgi:hypothetical protein